MFNHVKLCATIAEEKRVIFIQYVFDLISKKVVYIAHMYVMDSMHVGVRKILFNSKTKNKYIEKIEIELAKNFKKST